MPRGTERAIVGAVNIFLGGSGKFVAEDIQDSREFYNLDIGEPIAFDLDPTMRPGIRMRQFVAAGQSIIDGVGGVAREWRVSNPGRGIAPERGSSSPGPRTSPEHALLADIGDSVAANPQPTAGLFALRAHGLTVFSVMFDNRFALAGAGPGNDLRRYIDDHVREASANGAAPRINIVSSTAGGTGAGMIVPLALWLRAKYPAARLTLVAVTASAFAGVLQDASTLTDLRAKGLSGTYALLRELSFFREADTSTAFGPRRLPVTGGGLEYRPGGDLFHRVYWFGGRPGNRLEDAYREAEPLLRVLSDEQAAGDLEAGTGQRPLQWIVSASAVEYPKLRLQRRMVARVLKDAYRSLCEPAGAPGDAAAAPAPHENLSLLGYAADAPRSPLGEWLRDHAASLRGGLPFSPAESWDLADRVLREARAVSYEDTPRGTNVAGQNYDASLDEWRKRYVPAVVGDMQSRRNRNWSAIAAAAAGMRNREEAAFSAWLREQVFGDWLSAHDAAEPRTTDEASAALDAFEQEAARLAERFGSSAVFPIGDEHAADAARAEEEFERPPQRHPRPGAADRAVAFACAGAVLAGGAFLAVTQADGLALPIGLAASVAGAVGARWAALRLRLRRRVAAAAPAQVRREYEDRMIDSFARRERAGALRQVHAEIRGDDPNRAPLFDVFRGAVMQVREEVAAIGEVYRQLQARADQEAVSSGRRPDHVREVGDCVAVDPFIAETVLPDVRRRIRVDGSTGEPRVELGHLDAGDEGNVVEASESVAVLRRALTSAQDDDGGAARALERWESAAWRLVRWRIENYLPADFRSALLRCSNGNETAAQRMLAGAAEKLQLPRAPSTALSSMDAAPGMRRAYAGSNQILADLNSAMESGALPAAQRSAMSHYMNQAAGGARVAHTLGEQIVLLDLWADPGGSPWGPHVIGNATEISGAGGAMRTYYGLDGADAGATARDACFTIVPELLAATKIEIAEPPIVPLHPAVVARLLGCDPGMRGPTYAELFYLLRVRGLLRRFVEGDGDAGDEITEIAAGAGAPVRLVSRPRGSVSGDPLFARGREAIIDYDAFTEFMRYRGDSAIEGERDGFLPYPGVTARTDLWIAAPAAVAAVQRAAADVWYEGDVERDAADMARLLHEDLIAMEGGDEHARKSWAKAMTHLIAGERRKAVRADLIRGEGGGEPSAPVAIGQAGV